MAFIFVSDPSRKPLICIDYIKNINSTTSYHLYLFSAYLSQWPIIR